MNQEVATTTKHNLDDAVKDLFSQLHKPVNQYNAVIFFASISYDFALLSQKIHEHFPASQVIGTTTAGEICQKGFSSNSIVLTTMSDYSTKCSGLLIEDADKFPIIYKSDIEKQARSIGIKCGQQNANSDAFAITFINGLKNLEESVLALLNTTIGDESFKIAGGTAGDELKFTDTYVSYNGEVTDTGAAVLFFKTNKKFVVSKENIFKAVGHRATITEVVSETRMIKTIDNQSARKTYTNLLGVSESKANDMIFSHPLGRVFGDDIFISAFVKFDENGYAPMYCRITPGTLVEILEPIDEIAEAKKTCAAIKNEIPYPGFVFFVNCAFRTIEFSQNRTTEQIAGIWKQSFPCYAGFSSYGEQINRLNSNQTLVSLVIEE